MDKEILSLANSICLENSRISDEYDISRLHKLLLDIGVPPNVYGYTYIIRSIQLIIKDPGYMHYITKGLYIDIAKEFHATPARVERSIRHAINSTFAYGNTEFINSIFQNCIRPNRKVPSNSVFLSRLYYYLLGN